MSRTLRMLRIPAVLLAATLVARAGLDLRLPTENHHLFTGQNDRFYMYVDRIFEGEVTKPWEGGAFGYVRTAMRVNGEVILTKFHEGIDIAPVRRDRAGNPLDLVSAIADGTVVHTSMVSGRSNYGKYVVVEHPWENSKIYSLYAHLAEITCQPGQPVRAGGLLGRMGYTGAGINRTRAHVHLELAFLMSERFDDWRTAQGIGINYHGNFNGMNLAGCDVAGFFLEHKKNPELRFSEFIAKTPVHFKVTAPSRGTTPSFATRHPWIVAGPVRPSPSWEISFSATGQPVAFAPSDRTVDAPVVTAIRPSKTPHRYLTRGLVTGEDNHATLTSSGRALVSLLTDDFPSAPENASNR